MGFVTQDDVLFPNLTVRETLMYAALLRLPNSLTHLQKIKRAEDAIIELGLERYINFTLRICHHTFLLVSISIHGPSLAQSTLFGLTLCAH
jgi:hypothetical protein